MIYRNLSIWKNIDKYLLALYLLLVVAGYFTIYSSSFNGFDVEESYWSTSYGKQMIWILISIILGSIILLIEGNFIQNISYSLYLFVILLLIVVLFMPPVKGVSSWFVFGGFSIQPSEFAKLATSLAFAKYLSNINTRFQDFKTRIRAGLLVIIPALLIILQPDAGTMLVFVGFGIVRVNRLLWFCTQCCIYIINKMKLSISGLTNTQLLIGWSANYNIPIN